MIQRYMEPQITATTPADIAFDDQRSRQVISLASSTPKTAMSVYEPFVSDWRILRREIAAANGPHSAPIASSKIICQFPRTTMDAAIRRTGRPLARRKPEGGAPTDFRRASGGIFETKAGESVYLGP
jgi:trimethylamine--corrinoid protein Co-methyltransferase